MKHINEKIFRLIRKVTDLAFLNRHHMIIYEMLLVKGKLE